MKFKTVIALIILSILTGCGAFLNQKANPYYFGMTKFDSEKLKKPKKVKIYDFSQENLHYFIERGYKIKAKSAFRERYVDVSWAKLAAKQLGTPIMLLKTDYAGSVSGRRILSFRIPGEKYIVTSNTNSNLYYNSNTNAYAIGGGGYAVGSSSTYGSANYNSTTRTTIQAPDKYGYTTVPYENRYYDYFAVFLVKDPNYVMGIVNNTFLNNEKKKTRLENPDEWNEVDETVKSWWENNKDVYKDANAFTYENVGVIVSDINEKFDEVIELLNERHKTQNLVQGLGSYIKLKSIRGGYTSDKIIEYKWNTTTEQFEIDKELNINSMVYFDIDYYAFKRGENPWKYSNWKFLGEDKKTGKYTFNDNHKQLLEVDPVNHTVTWYTNKENQIWTKAIVWVNLTPDSTIKPKE